MFDLNGCNLRYDAYWARTARITAHGWEQESARQGRTARARLAAALLARAARLVPAARPPAPGRPSAPPTRP